MAAKKPKFPKGRVLQSDAFNEGNVQIGIYTSNPRIEITVRGSYSDDVQSDLRNAIDDVLKHHSL